MLPKHENPNGHATRDSGFPLTSDLKTDERCFSWTGTFTPVDYQDQEITMTEDMARRNRQLSAIKSTSEVTSQ